MNWLMNKLIMYILIMVLLSSSAFALPTPLIFYNAEESLDNAIASGFNLTVDDGTGGGGIFGFSNDSKVGDYSFNLTGTGVDTGALLINDTMGTFQTGIKTIDFWFKTQASISWDESLISFGDLTGTKGVHFSIESDDSTIFSISPDQGTGTVSGNTSITLNEWHQIIIILDDATSNLNLYIDGQTWVNFTRPSFDYKTTYTAFMIGGRDAKQGMSTSLFDNIAIFDEEYTDQDIIDSWNGGAGTDFLGAAPSATPTPTIVAPTPNDGNFTNDADQTINITHSDPNVGYYLYFGNNSILNETHLVLTNATGDATGYINYTATLNSNTYFFKAKVINRTNNNISSNTTIRNFTVDLESPTLITIFVNDSFFSNTNLTGQFNFSDNIGIHSINVSVDGSSIFNLTNISNTVYILNLSYNISTLSIGQHDLSIKWADGHTANELGGDYDTSNGLFNDYLKYDFYDNGNIKTELKSKSMFDEWSSEKRTDRYIQILEPATPSDTITLVEESDMPIYIAYKEGSYNDYWIIMGNHWKDYVLEGESNIEVSINRINDKKVEVTISGIKNKDRLVFNSVGDLNVVTREYSFYAINMTETFDTLITEGFEFNLDLDVDFGNIEFDISGITPFATLQWNSTNFTSTTVSFDATGASFRKTFNPIGIETRDLITHNWWFNFSTFTDGYLRTNDASQIASSISIDVCNATFTNYTILNLTYFDEVNDESIAVTNAYQLTIFDGTFYYNQTGSFVNNVTSSFCTNLDPLVVTYNWDMWGLITLSKDTYITRVLDIDESVPIELSNNPQTNLSLFLIGTLNSSTVTYTWQTKSFQPIDGTMRIFRCNPDGTKNLIESIPIISGTATANIQLLLQTYSYDVIINGVLFSDLESYSRCHVESLTTATFFVDVNPIDIAPLIGLASIECTLEESATNNSVTMTWTTNPELSGYVSGCIIADRRTIRGSVNVLENCSIESEGFTRTIAIPVVDGNNYVIRGRLEQENNKIICDDTVILTPGQEQGGLFSISGLFAVIFLVSSLALIYASDGEFMLAGGAIGLVASWFLGILVFDWLVVSGIIFFFALIAVTGRYTRKR